MTKNYESGRSMVEMLGTLAIIGVLSIGGIAGYSYGMDKYRANETMRDISLRTVDLITQANHAADLSFAEWENEDSIYDFSNPTYVEGENLIAFDIGATKKLPQSVCQMVFDNLSATAVQIDINESVATSKDSCDEDNTMTFYFSSGSTTIANTGTTDSALEQCGDTVCNVCQKCDITTETCIAALDYEQKCTIDGKTGWCISGTCAPDTVCNCGSNEYCTYTNDDNCTPFPSGSCNNLDFRTLDISGTTYYISNDKMNWWNAVSACEALGNKKFVSAYDLIKDWDGSGSNSSGKAIRTALGDTLYEKIWNSSGSPYIWLSMADSCYGYCISLDNSFSYDRVRKDDYFYAICK